MITCDVFTAIFFAGLRQTGGQVCGNELKATAVKAARGGGLIRDLPSPVSDLRLEAEPGAGDINRGGD